MKAMILAAGLGTRLKPLTESKPKALVEVAGKTLLEHTINKLIFNGFDEIVINVHHFADLIIEFLKNNTFTAKIYISEERGELLDTGGGILNAKDHLVGGKPFLVHNVDIISDINLRDFYSRHQDSSLATLAVSQRESSRVFLFDEEMRLSGWRNKSTGESTISRNTTIQEQFSFCGIHVISPKIFNLINTKGAFSIINTYLNLCIQHSIVGIDLTGNSIIDVGKADNLKSADVFLQSK